MWDFVNAILEKGGVAAALLALVIIGCGVAIRQLWKENQTLQMQLRTQTDQHLNKMQELTAQYVSERKQQSSDFAVRLTANAERVDELQERRIKEARDVTERVMSYMSHFDQFAAKLETLIEMILSERSKR